VVRYLGLPTPDDNLAGYQASDVTAKAKKLDGKKFLIVHGTAGTHGRSIDKFAIQSRSSLVVFFSK
jgi:hypothetical protein